MESNTTRSQEKENPSVQTSPRTTSSGSGSTHPPLTPKTITRQDNPYPTTFIQADTSSFKQVVQMLTGSTETASKPPSPPSKTPIQPRAATAPKKPAFKLYERRHSSFKNLKICPLVPGSNPNSPIPTFSPRYKAEILSPSMLDLPSLVLSPVTPLIADPFNRHTNPNSPLSGCVFAEDRAIAEKGFYLHPSPRGAAEPPRLLPLFPVTKSSTSDEIR